MIKCEPAELNCCCGICLSKMENLWEEPMPWGVHGEVKFGFWASLDGL